MKKIPFSEPTINHEEVAEVKHVLLSGHLTTGQETAWFEKEFAKYVGSKYAVFVNSCTSALKLSVLWKKKQLDEVWTVIVPSLTFTATVNEVVEAGMLPLFADVREGDLCLDIKGKYKNTIVITVHLGGNESKIRGKHVIYDSAHLIRRGCHIKNSIGCYSFYPTKNMTTGEGGMICTDDKKFRDWAIKARHHGRSKAIGSSDVEFISSKYNNTDIAAAIGRVQLRALDYFNKRRDEIVEWYNEKLGTKWTGNHLFIIRVKRRDRFMKLMEKAGIGASIHFHPVHKMSAYKKDYGHIYLPVTEKVSKEIVSLPLFPTLTREEVNYICEEVTKSGLLLR